MLLTKVTVGSFFYLTIYRVSSGYHSASLQEMPWQMEHVGVHPLCVILTSRVMISNYIADCIIPFFWVNYCWISFSLRIINIFQWNNSDLAIHRCSKCTTPTSYWRRVDHYFQSRFRMNDNPLTLEYIPLNVISSCWLKTL